MSDRDNPFNRQSQMGGKELAQRAWGQPNKKGDAPGEPEPEDGESEIPKGGKFHSMRVEAADNGYSVTTTHKVPRPKVKDSKGQDSPSSYPGDDGMQHQEKTTVFNHKRQLVDHMLKNC